jgi:protein NirF
VRDAGKVMIYDTRTFEKTGEIDAESPSGIFFTARAHRTGL